MISQQKATIAASLAPAYIDPVYDELQVDPKKSLGLIIVWVGEHILQKIISKH